MVNYIDFTRLSEYPQVGTMWDQDLTREPTVYRLDQKRGPVAVHAIRRSERDWPITLDDCQAALLQLLPRLRSEKSGYSDYWRWVARTRAEMNRIYQSHRQDCRTRQNWDLAGLWRLRCRLEWVTLRLYCAPLTPARAESRVLFGISQFNRVTA